MIVFEDVITKMESIVAKGYSVEKWDCFKGQLMRLIDPPPQFSSPPTRDQYMRLYNLGVNLLEQGYFEMARGAFTHLYITVALDHSGFHKTDTGLDGRYTRNYIFGDTLGNRTLLYLLADFIKNAGGEQVEHIVQANTSIGGFNRQRNGYIAISENRIYLLGREVIPAESYAERYYLWYPDLTEKSYYGCLDYVPLKNLLDARVRYGRLDKNLLLRFRNVDYIKSNPRTLYGPFFFKTRVSDKVQREHGEIQMTVRLPKHEEESRSEHKARHRELSLLLLRRGGR